MMLLLVGERYGAIQASGLSATHEEYREARERKPVFVFVQAGVSRETGEQQFLDEVQAWATGHLRASFSTPEELKAAVIRALHDYALATATAGANEGEMATRAHQLISAMSSGRGEPQLLVAITAGPHQQVIRPVELEDPALARDIQREALFGQHAVFSPQQGMTTAVRGNALILEQADASVLVDQAGSVRIAQPARRGTARRGTEIPALIEEDVANSLATSLRFAGWLLDRVDSVRRLSDVVVAAHLADAGYMAFRTRAEHAASPNSAAMGSGSDDPTVMLTPARRHRRALNQDAGRIAQDLTVLLRRSRRR
jgi:hypothetical protein